MPEQIHVVKGVQFESTVMAKLCDLRGVSRLNSTPYHPQANGIVEKTNRVLDLERFNYLSQSRGVGHPAPTHDAGILGNTSLHH